MSLDDWTIARLNAAVCDAVALCGGKTESSSYLILSQTSAGKSQFFTQIKRLAP
jgi:hypothetical protein